LFELLVELRVFADVDVRELLCPSPPADVGVTGELSRGEVGEFGSCSFVRFFLRNPRVGIRAQVTWMRREIDRGTAWSYLPASRNKSIGWLSCSGKGGDQGM